MYICKLVRTHSLPFGLDRDKTAFHAYLSGKEVIPPTGYGTSKKFCSVHKPSFDRSETVHKDSGGGFTRFSWPTYFGFCRFPADFLMAHEIVDVPDALETFGMVGNAYIPG